jgi:hypothetical protein
MKFDPLTKEILFYDLSEDNFGTHEVKVTLTDTDDEKTSETFFFDIKNGIHQQEKQLENR